MKLFNLLALGSLLAITGACGSTTEKNSGTILTERSSDSPLKKRTGWKQKKSSYIEKQEMAISQVDKQIRTISSKTKTLSEDKREEASTYIDEAKGLLSEVRDDLGELRESSPDEWKEDKRAFSKKMNSLEGKIFSTNEIFE